MSIVVHELSIALAIVRSVDTIAVERGYARVEAVTLAIGELSGVDRHALSFAWDLATAGSRAAGSRIDFREVALEVKCPSCGVHRHPDKTWQLACPSCPAVPPEILAGRDLCVVALEVPN